MAINSCRLKKLSTGLDEDYQRTYTLIYLVSADAEEPATEVRDAPGAVVKGTYYSLYGETDLGAVCTNIDADQISEDGKLWQVTVTFGYIEDPDETESELTWDIVEVQLPINYDIEGNAIVDSVGNFFVEQEEKVFRYSKATATLIQDYSASTWADYFNCTNSDTFLGKPPGSLRVMVTGRREQEPEDLSYKFRNTYEFEYNPLGWDSRPLDAGFWAKDGNDKIVRIQMAGRRDAEEPQLLDGEGAELNPIDQNTGERTIDPPPPPVFLEYQIYDRVPFSVFNFITVI